MRRSLLAVALALLALAVFVRLQARDGVEWAMDVEFFTLMLALLVAPLFGFVTLLALGGALTPLPPGDES